MCDDGPCRDYNPKTEDVRAKRLHRIQLTVALYAEDAICALADVIENLPDNITYEHINAGLPMEEEDW